MIFENVWQRLAGECMITLESLFDLPKQVLSEPILAYQCDPLVMAQLPQTVTVLEEGFATPLPFKTFQFAYALSSAPFFEHQDSAKTLIQLQTLLHVAKEVRLSPYYFDQATIVEKLGPVMLALQQHNIGVEIVPLALPELDKAVRIKLWAQTCQLD